MGISTQKSDLNKFLTLDLQKGYIILIKEYLKNRKERRNNIFRHYLKGLTKIFKTKTYKVGLFDQD